MAESQHRAKTRFLACIAAVLVAADPARASEPSFTGDIAAGIPHFDAGYHNADVGLFVDLGASWLPWQHVVLRGGVGVLETANRHLALETYARVRAEAALRTRFWRLEPILGMGALLTDSSPSVHALAGIGFNVASDWTLAIDARAGRFWDQREFADAGSVGLLEAQLRLSWAIH